MHIIIPVLIVTIFMEVVYAMYTSYQADGMCQCITTFPCICAKQQQNLINYPKPPINPISTVGPATFPNYGQMVVPYPNVNRNPIYQQFDNAQYGCHPYCAPNVPKNLPKEIQTPPSYYNRPNACYVRGSVSCIIYESRIEKKNKFQMDDLLLDMLMSSFENNRETYVREKAYKKPTITRMCCDPSVPKKYCFTLPCDEELEKSPTIKIPKDMARIFLKYKVCKMSKKIMECDEDEMKRFYSWMKNYFE